MNVMHPPDTTGEQATPVRVRDQARQALVLMGFSLAVSIGCVLLLVLTHHVAQGTGR